MHTPIKMQVDGSGTRTIAHRSKRHFLTFLKFYRRDITGIHIEGDGVNCRNADWLMCRRAESFVELELDKTFEHIELKGLVGDER